jgi:hypothetical protein
LLSGSCLGRDAEADRVCGGGELVEFQEFGAGSIEADLQAFDFSEPSLAAGLVDAGDEVVADVEEAVALGWVRA